MINIFDEYTQLQSGNNWDRPTGEAMATLVLAKVLQEVGQAITAELNQLPAGLEQAYLRVQAGEYRP